MRFATYMMMIVLSGITVTGYSQTISFSGKNVSLQSFFSAIKSQTGYTVFYSNEVITQSHPVTLDLKNASLQNALNEALKNQPLEYDIQSNAIFISVKQSGKPASDPVTNNARTLYGNVRDSSGRPISNASVTIMNQSKSVMTKADGNFAIQVKKGDSILIISCIGYENREVKIIAGFIHIEMANNVNPLEQVIVGGNMTAIRRKAETTSLTIINSKTLDALPVNDISQVFRGLVPGTNSFSTGDETEEAATLTIRGAGSELSVSQIAVYVDGIEFAGGSGYLATLNKENIDRIEVLRGPASSTLYGTGSNGGIVQVFTKQGAPGQSNLNFTASAGFMKSKWVHSDPFQQFYAIETVTGLKNAAVTLGGTYTSNGAFLPKGGGRSETVYAGLKWNPVNKLTANFTVRHENTRRHESRNPSYDTAIHPNASAIAQGFGPSPPVNKDLDAGSYLIGVNLSHKTTDHWTNNLTAGYTQNGYNELPATNDSGNIPLQRYYFISVNKITTLRYSNTLTVGNQIPDDFNLSITSGLEYKRYFYQRSFISAMSFNFNGDPADNNYGIFMEAHPSYKNIFLTLGLRYDHNNYFKDNGSFNPRIGITTNFNIRNTMIVKPRISWGSGITAPAYAYRYGDPANFVIPNAEIKPQDQRGFEYGLEFFSLKNRFNFEAVYYDNRLKNMFVLNDMTPPGTMDFKEQYINVGDISNTGWEFSGSYNLNEHFSVNGTFSAMSSVIKDSSGDYHSTQLAGKAPGTQLRNLPRHTAGLFLKYNFSRLPLVKGHGSISFNITEVDGVIAFDAARFEPDFAYGRTNDTISNFTAPYWTTSGIIIRLGLNVDYYLTNNLRFFIQGSNIANNNKFENGSLYPTYGASWMFGIKFNLIH